MDDLSTRRKWMVLVGLSLGLFLAMADATIMSIATPELMYQLNTSIPNISWVMNGYNLVLTVLFLTMGKVADHYGRKLVFTTGLAVFTAASLGCAFSPTIYWLIGFRGVQAVGGAAIVPVSLAILLGAFPQRQQGLSAGLFGAVSTFAAALGPVLGGVLIARGAWHWHFIHLHGTWQWIFLFNVPVGLVGLALALVLVPRRQRERATGRIDFVGVALVSVGLFCLTLALIQSNAWHWGSARILALFAAAAVVLGLFIFWELRSPNPLLDLRLFKRRAFSSAAVAIMTVDVAMMGTAFILVIYMVALMDFKELRAAAAIAVMPLASLVLTPLTGWTIDRIGPRWLAVTGAACSAAGLFALGHITLNSSLGSIMWRTALVGIGLGLSLPSLMASGMSALHDAVKGVGSGALNTARQLGFLLGVAILVAVFGITMQNAVHSAARQARTWVAQSPYLSIATRDSINSALAAADRINATADMTQIRQVAHPIGDIPQPADVNEALALLDLSNRMETLYIDKVAQAFRGPFYTAGIAALLAVIPGFLLPRRLPKHAAAAFI
jgi:EmrB/QacA subfamily drug resistance transporter